MFRSILIVIALLTGSHAQANDSVDKVILTYVPQPGLTGYIEYYGDRLKIQDGVESIEMSMTGTVLAKTVKHPDGVLSLTTEPTFNFETSNTEMKQFMDPILGALSSVEIRAVISDEGELLRLEGMEQALATTRKSVSTLIDTLPVDFKPMMNNLVNASLSEEALFVKAQDNLSLQLTQWIGGELEKGYIYETEFNNKIPEFGNITVGFDGVYEYLGKISCNEADETLSCAELSFQSSMKTEHAKQLTKAVSEQLKLPIDDDFTMTFDTTVIVVAEPSTLKPFSVSKIKRVGAPANDGSGWLENIQRTNSVYYYK